MSEEKALIAVHPEGEQETGEMRPPETALSLDTFAGKIQFRWPDAEGAHRKKSKTEVTQESTNFYATNFQLGSMSPLFIHQVGRSRWRIDTQVFQTLTADCHLKHPAVHQSTAIIVLTMIRLLAYTLSLLFFKRQVCSHARGDPGTFLEFAKRLAYWFVALSTNST